jgi:hypothetical protein
MKQILFGIAAASIFTLLTALPAAGQARPLALTPANGHPVTPFMEGWYANEDGTFTISFGYLNRNEDQVVRIPVGERNSIEPAEFEGKQPTVFQPGRHRGVFVVTVPSADVEALWTIVNENGEVHEVPGRATSHAYQLDRNPRPAGSLSPLVGFSEGGPWGSDPTGIVSDRRITARVGEPVALEMWLDDLSQRDPADPRSQIGKTLRVVWSLYQSPPAGNVEFGRHEASPQPETPDEAPTGRPPAPVPGPEEVMLPGPGAARVYATFDAPGEYLVRAQVDNWRALDSSSGNQCCWSNGYLPVTVIP